MLRIVHGAVYDPANGLDGEERTIAVKDGRIVAESELDPTARTIDARGMIVLPGGVDLHAHIAGPKVNAARKMRPEDHRRAAPVPRTSVTRSGVMGSTPSTFATGYRYTELGYTTVFDAAVPPLGARHAHEELDDTPLIDKGFFVLLGNNAFVLQALRERNHEKVRDFAAWAIGAAKGYAMKLVNPGGVEAWKNGQGNVTELDEPIAAFGVTPREVIVALAQAAEDLGLPHAAHIHANHLGVPGNWTTTLDTMKALEGRRAHLAHVQFHSYGGEPGKSLSSRVADLADYVNAHPNITVDVGQVVFGDTTSLTGDAPLGYYLQGLTGRKWFNGDVEMEEGCGIVPIRYKRGSPVHATQWAIGLEWFLLVDDPWRIALTTDHPNGGSFTAYPEIIRLLMDRDRRKEVLKSLPSKVLRRTRLAEIDRQYSLGEIVTITRAAPARILGLDRKGHLGIGADADVAIYDGSDPAAALARARCVIRAGEVVVEDGAIVADARGRTFYVEPEHDPAIVQDVRSWFEQFYSLDFENYPVTLDYLPRPERVPTGRDRAGTATPR
jgi:formylmethanofuran dehydrogenase subunit A